MGFIVAVVNTAVVAAVGGWIAWASRGRFDRLEQRIDLLQSSLDATRSDLTQVALAVRARPRPSSR